MARYRYTRGTRTNPDNAKDRKLRRLKGYILRKLSSTYVRIRGAEFLWCCPPIDGDKFNELVQRDGTKVLELGRWNFYNIGGVELKKLRTWWNCTDLSSYHSTLIAIKKEAST